MGMLSMSPHGGVQIPKIEEIGEDPPTRECYARKSIPQLRVSKDWVSLGGS